MSAYWVKYTEKHGLWGLLHKEQEPLDGYSVLERWVADGDDGRLMYFLEVFGRGRNDRKAVLYRFPSAEGFKGVVDMSLQPELGAEIVPTPKRESVSVSDSDVAEAAEFLGWDTYTVLASGFSAEIRKK